MTSPRRIARLAGLFFLLTIVAGIFSQGFVSEKLIDFGNATATANHILAHQVLFQIGFTVYLVEMTCQIATAVFFYQLLKPVNGTVALLALVFELAGCIIKVVARVFYIASLPVLANERALSGFTSDQVRALALVLLKVNDRGAGVALAFFGLSTPLNGFLILRSTFLPRWLGALSLIVGLGWLTFFYQPLGYRVFMFIALAGLLGAAAMIFWLVVFAVNEERWREVASSASRAQASPR